MKKQLAAARNAAESSKAAKDFKANQGQDPKKNATTTSGTKLMTKKTNKGCCGGDSKCSIMWFVLMIL